jgi:hypothetical protein
MPGGIEEDHDKSVIKPISGPVSPENEAAVSKDPTAALGSAGFGPWKVGNSPDHALCLLYPENCEVDLVGI